MSFKSLNHKCVCILPYIIALSHIVTYLLNGKRFNAMPPNPTFRGPCCIKACFDYLLCFRLSLWIVFMIVFGVLFAACRNKGKLAEGCSCCKSPATRLNHIKQQIISTYGQCLLCGTAEHNRLSYYYYFTKF